MAQVTLSIGGRSYDLGCRAGEEAHFTALAGRVDGKARLAQAAVGGMTEVRQLLLAALLLADDLDQGAPTAPVPSPPVEDPRVAAAIESVAVRLESLAETLENGAAKA